MQLASVLAPLAVENYKGQIFCWKKQEHRYLLFSFFQNKPSFQASQQGRPGVFTGPVQRLKMKVWIYKFLNH
jgi:hypothetical protein